MQVSRSSAEAPMKVEASTEHYVILASIEASMEASVETCMKVASTIASMDPSTEAISMEASEEGSYFHGRFRGSFCGNFRHFRGRKVSVEAFVEAPEASTEALAEVSMGASALPWKLPSTSMTKTVVQETGFGRRA